jgi:hypothetical protein
MSSQGGPASDEELAAVAALSEIRRSLAEARQRYMGLARRADQIYSEIQASRGGELSEEELAAIAGNLAEERQLYMAAMRQPYMALYHHGDLTNSAIQAMQAARGVAAPASTRGIGGMAARPRHWATPDSTSETPYSKSAAGWRPASLLRQAMIRAAPPGAGARAGPTREAPPPTPPKCGCPVPAWIIARRRSDYIAGSEAPWIRAGIQVTDCYRGVPSASRARPHPYDPKARPHFGIPSARPRSNAPQEVSY